MIALIVGGGISTLSQVVGLPLKRIPDLWMVDMSQPRPHPDGRGHFRGYFDLVRRTYKNQGIWSFWKGTSVMMAVGALKAIGLKEFLTAATHTVNLGFFGHPKESDGEDGTSKQILNSAKYVAASFVSIGISMLFTFPPEYLYLRYSVQLEGQKNMSQFPNVRSLVSQTYAQNGFRGFFRGMVPTYLSTFLYRSMFFALYDITRPLANSIISSQEMNMMSMAVNFGFAQAIALISVLSTIPFQVVSKRLMMQNCRPDPQFQGMLEGLSYIKREEGLKSLFRGGLFKIGKSTMTAMVLVIYDEVMRMQARTN